MVQLIQGAVGIADVLLVRRVRVEPVIDRVDAFAEFVGRADRLADLLDDGAFGTCGVVVLEEILLRASLGGVVELARHTHQAVGGLVEPFAGEAELTGDGPALAQQLGDHAGELRADHRESGGCPSCEDTDRATGSGNRGSQCQECGTDHLDEESSQHLPQAFAKNANHSAGGGDDLGKVVRGVLRALIGAVSCSGRFAIAEGSVTIPRFQVARRGLVIDALAGVLGGEISPLCAALINLVRRAEEGIKNV